MTIQITEKNDRERKKDIILFNINGRVGCVGISYTFPDPSGRTVFLSDAF